MKRKKTDGMVNYQNGKIYRISSVIGGVDYYGSTTVALSKRIGEHRSKYKSYLNGKYDNVTSFEVLAFSDAEIILVESFPCNSKEELHARERHYIESNDCVNKYVPGRTDKEYYADNREKIAERMAEYRDNNRAKINEKFNCICGGKYTTTGKSQHDKTLKHRRYLESLPPPEYTA